MILIDEHDANTILQRLQDTGLLELSSAEAAARLVSPLADLFEASGSAGPAQLATVLAEWLMERPEVVDVFGTDEELLQCVTDSVGSSPAEPT